VTYKLGSYIPEDDILHSLSQGSVKDETSEFSEQSEGHAPTTSIFQESEESEMTAVELVDRDPSAVHLGTF
jgi:hypothetical protein